jgi:hypothetical protein
MRKRDRRAARSFDSDVRPGAGRTPARTLAAAAGMAKGPGVSCGAPLAGMCGGLKAG